MEKYEKLHIVGRGAYGVCTLCKKRGDLFGEKVVIKSITLHGLSEKEHEAIMGEANLLRKMNHPAIIGYYEYFVHDGNFSIVMQYAEGGTLERFIREQKGLFLPETTVLNYFTQLLLGLDYIHKLSILHRDLKTQNILMNRKHTLLKLSDFGISKELSTKGVASTVIGTPNYLSPEICEGRSYNQKSDIWSLGCVLYEMLMLKLAFNGENLPAIVMKITKSKYEPIGQHVSQPTKEMVMSLLEVNEKKRPVIKDLLTCPAILPYTLKLHLDLGRLQSPDKKRQRLPSTSSSFSNASTVRASGAQIDYRSVERKPSVGVRRPYL